MPLPMQLVAVYAFRTKGFIGHSLQRRAQGHRPQPPLRQSLEQPRQHLENHGAAAAAAGGIAIVQQQDIAVAERRWSNAGTPHPRSP